MRSYQMRVGFKSRDRCPHEKGEGALDTDTRSRHREKGHMKTEAE